MTMTPAQIQVAKVATDEYDTCVARLESFPPSAERDAALEHVAAARESAMAAIAATVVEARNPGVARQVIQVTMDGDGHVIGAQVVTDAQPADVAPITPPQTMPVRVVTESGVARTEEQPVPAAAAPEAPSA